LRFLSRLAKAGLGIVPFRRTLRHLRPYTFKQAIAFRGLSCLAEPQAIDRVEKAWPVGDVERAFSPQR